VIEEFPPGKGMCGPAFNATRNIKSAAIAQGEGEWWETISSHPQKLRAVVAAYMARVSPDVTGSVRNKRKAFCVAQYKVARDSLA
jgi:hypothetical protein